MKLDGIKMKLDGVGRARLYSVRRAQLDAEMG